MREREEREREIDTEQFRMVRPTPGLDHLFKAILDSSFPLTDMLTRCISNRNNPLKGQVIIDYFLLTKLFPISCMMPIMTRLLDLRSKYNLSLRRYRILCSVSLSEDIQVWGKKKALSLEFESYV